MAIAYVGLGSNLGDGQDNLLRAWRRLGEVKGIRLVQLSSPYATESVEMESACWFTNAVGKIVTELAPSALLQECLRIENEFGRDRRKTRDRRIDLDLLYYDDLVLAAAGLTVPHPGIEKRLFVLAPLAELAPDLRHPVLQRTTRELLADAAHVRQGIEKKVWRNDGGFR